MKGTLFNKRFFNFFLDNSAVKCFCYCFFFFFLVCWKSGIQPQRLASLRDSQHSTGKASSWVWQKICFPGCSQDLQTWELLGIQPRTVTHSINWETGYSCWRWPGVPWAGRDEHTGVTLPFAKPFRFWVCCSGLFTDGMGVKNNLIFTLWCSVSLL